jgi:hypothetical protein
VLPNGGIIEKYKNENAAPTETPTVHFTQDVLLAMAQVARMLNVHYFFGVPFLETNVDGNASIVSAKAQEILGDSLLALQLANEPDLYGRHLKKWPEYGMQDFYNETNLVGLHISQQKPNTLPNVLQMIQSLPINNQIMMGPSGESNHLESCLVNVANIGIFKYVASGTRSM